MIRFARKSSLAMPPVQSVLNACLASVNQVFYGGGETDNILPQTLAKLLVTQSGAAGCLLYSHAPLVLQGAYHTVRSPLYIEDEGQLEALLGDAYKLSFSASDCNLIAPEGAKRFKIIACKTAFKEHINGVVILYRQVTSPDWPEDVMTMLSTIVQLYTLALTVRSSQRQLALLGKQNEELTKALSEERRATRIQSEFISMASHEFRTPLAIINSSTEVIRRQSPVLNNVPENEESVKARQFLQNQLRKISKAVVRMSHLIDSTLNLSKIEMGKVEFAPQVYRLDALLHDLLSYTEESYPQVSFSYNVSNAGISVSADKDLFHQAIGNLIANAVKYTPKNPVVVLITRQLEQQCEIRIEDNGSGIPPEDLPRICEKFFRASNSLGIAGTGLGLYLTKYFIELHRGSLHIESILGKGTTVRILLPIHTNEIAS